MSDTWFRTSSVIFTSLLKIFTTPFCSAFTCNWIRDEFLFVADNSWIDQKSTLFCHPTGDTIFLPVSLSTKLLREGAESSNSLSSEGAESSELLMSGWTSTSYSGILPLPWSDFGLSYDVFSSRGGSCGPISSIELGLSFGGGLGQFSSSELAFNSSSIRSDGVASGLYQDADLSKTTSRLIRTARVKGLKHLYAFFADKYPMRIHRRASLGFRSGYVHSQYFRSPWGARGWASFQRGPRMELARPRYLWCIDSWDRRPR